ncbi:MAG: hypothetical protein IIX99_04770, partial [Oscillospiraceae bacterium]|nr:hypothetical protein [Oscillospiraceae bacterium]
MRKMRITKLSALLLSLVLLFSLVACGEKAPVVEDETGKEVVQEAPSTDPAVKEEAEEKTETPAEKAEETKPVAGDKKENTGSAASASGESEKISAEVKPEAPAQEEAPAAEEKKEETPAAEEKKEEKEEEISSDVEAPEASDVIASDSVINVEVAEVASAAELLAAMSDEKVSEIKVTQNVSVGSTITVSGSKTVSGAKITAGKDVAVMYEVPAGASLTIKQCVIDGAGKAGQFVKSSGQVSISNAEIKNFTDAALYNGEGGVMALNYVTVSGCTSASSGGAIKNYADMAVKNTTFKNNTSDNNGGAIFSGSGAVTKVEACRFEGNSAKKGAGAMWLNGEVFIDGCTFEGNKAGTYGGAVYCNNSVTGLVTNCTFKANRAEKNQGGAFYAARSNLNRAQVRIEKCHFEGNYAFQYGGAVGNAAYLTIINCDFIKNHSDEHAGAVSTEQGSSIAMAGCNFRGNTAVDCGGAIRNNGDMTLDQCVFTENDAFGDGGGGFYSTAFGGSILTNCKFINNKASNSAGIGGGSYIYASNNYSPGALFENCEFTGNTSVGNGGGLYNMGWVEVVKCTFTKNVTNGASGAIHNQKGNLKLIDSKIIANTSKEHGGAMRNQGGLGYIKDSYFADNYSEKSGGVAYFNTTSETKVVDCTFENNKAKLNAGALFLYGNTSDGLSENVIEGCTFKGNAAGSYGGAIRNQGVLTIRDCDLLENRSGLRGGAIYCNSLGQMNMVDCELIENTADTDGAAMAFGGYTESESSGVSTDTGDGSTSEFDGMTSQVKIVNSVMRGNHTTDDWGRGGAIYNSGNVGMLGVLIEDCYAGYTGGAIHNNGLLNIEDSDFVDCHSNPDKIVLYARGGGDRLYCRGGAIYTTNRKGNELIVKGSTFDGCSTTEYGGAIAINGNAGGTYAEITKCDFIGNSTKWRGGAISNSAITTVESCSFIDNYTTERQGGAIFNYDVASSGVHAPGRLTVKDSDFSGNSAATDGGAICNSGVNGTFGEVSIDGCT